MVVTTTDIRQILTNITEDMMPEDTIRQAISLAQVRVNRVKRSNIPISDIEAVVKIYAVYLSYEFFVNKITRQRGSVPLEVLATVTRYKTLAEEYIAEIAWNKVPLPVGGLSETAYTEEDVV